MSTNGVSQEKLKGNRDGNGTLLNNTVIMWGANMGNSNQHQHYDVSPSSSAARIWSC